MQSIAPNLLTTERLILRQWQESDRDAFARLNADPVVREFFPRVQTREESDADAGRIHKAIEERGWGFWAVEVRGGASFIGFFVFVTFIGIISATKIFTFAFAARKLATKSVKPTMIVLVAMLFQTSFVP